MFDFAPMDVTSDAGDVQVVQRRECALVLMSGQGFSQVAERVRTKSAHSVLIGI